MKTRKSDFIYAMIVIALMTILTAVLSYSANAQTLGMTKEYIEENYDFADHGFNKDGYEFYLTYMEGGKIYYFLDNTSSYIEQVKFIIWSPETFETFIDIMKDKDNQYEFAKDDDGGTYYVSEKQNAVLFIEKIGVKWYIYLESL